MVRHDERALGWAKLRADKAARAAKIKADAAADKVKGAAEKTKARNKALAAQGFAPDGTLLPNFWVNPYTGRVEKTPAGTYIGPGGKPVRIATPGWGAAGKPAFSPADRVQLETDFRADAREHVSKMIVLDEKTGIPQRKPPKKAQIVRDLFNIYGRALLRAGFKENQIKAWATQVVNSFPDRYWNPNLYKPKKPVGGGASEAEVLG